MCNVLSEYLRLLESAQSLTLAALAESPLRHSWPTMLRTGMLKTARRAANVICPSCSHLRVIPVRDGDIYVANCVRCSRVTIDADLVHCVRASRSWLFAAVIAQLRAAALATPRELVHGRLWEIATITARAAISVAIALTPGDAASEEQVAAALCRPGGPTHWLLLTSRRSPLQHVWHRGRRVLATIEDVCRLHSGSLQLDRQRVFDLLELQTTPKSAATISIADDGSWLHVDGRELRLTGKQRDFALVMVEAYQQGQRRPRLEWVLRRAGYTTSSSALKHVSKRDDFLDFFGYGNGEVWIRTAQ